MAVALVITSLSVSISPFWLGHFVGFSTATGPVLTPSVLAEPFLVLAIWRGILREPVCAVTACVLAILTHPALGVDAARIALTVALSHCLWLAWPYCPRIREYGRFALDFLIVSVVTGLFWIVPAIASVAIFLLQWNPTNSCISLPTFNTRTTWSRSHGRCGLLRERPRLPRPS